MVVPFIFLVAIVNLIVFLVVLLLLQLGCLLQEYEVIFLFLQDGSVQVHSFNELLGLLVHPVLDVVSIDTGIEHIVGLVGLPDLVLEPLLLGLGVADRTRFLRFSIFFLVAGTSVLSQLLVLAILLLYLFDVSLTKCWHIIQVIHLLDGVLELLIHLGVLGEDNLVVDLSLRHSLLLLFGLQGLVL